MGLHEYKVKVGNRRGETETTVLLSDEDAERQGLTAKDRVTKKDLNTGGDGGGFEPKTEADLAGQVVTSAKGAPKPANKQAAAPADK